ncbi:hypothetical protein QE450_003611 [Paenibacillus sp. SORGH_AS306]|uniref:hypothetical protein n=1 Tax=Paenibacillus sp. SORGH_AS_0306 TaxID=3041754 RepID=UPI00277D2629|nr:hypothetical protein [Paenibacillus sp. SORGH_AS_0306]MDQ1236113.1 hypothetical protein [Paenibacillus sp. SORGH_AS_0306]
MTKDKILIDTTVYYSKITNPTLTIPFIRYFELSAGDQIIAYQDNQEWEGVIEYEPDWPIESRYYIDLNKGIQRFVSSDIALGREEGLHSGWPFGYSTAQNHMIKALDINNVNSESIEKYSNYAIELSREKYKSYAQKSKNKILKIEIDTNSNYLGFTKPIIFLEHIKYFNILEGDRIVGYQDEQEWEAIVEYQADLPEGYRYYLDVDKCIETIVPKEVYEARNDGVMLGISIGKIETKIIVAQAMFQDGVDIEKIQQYTDMTLAELKYILQE